MEENKQKNKRARLIIVGAAIFLIGLVGVTYSFFNYTRTGTQNTLRTGRIAFNAEQGTAINLSDAFPIDVTGGIPSNNPNVGSVTINVTGDTTYNNGIEYLVTAANVENTIGSGQNAKTIPISIDVSVASNTENEPATTLGTADADYFSDRGPSAQTSIYKVLASDTITTDDQLLVGYIKSGQTGVDGNIVIRAYIDADKVAITDTYNGPSSTPSDTNGTTSEWVDDRVVLTTTEWNNLQSTGITFQVKVEANEGIWVDEPVQEGTIPSCPGCKFIYSSIGYNYSEPNYFSAPLSTLTTFANNNETLVDDYRLLNKNFFLGFKFDGSGNVTNAYACGIKGENPNNGTPFCIEGALSDAYGGDSTTRAAIYTANSDILYPIYGTYDSETELGCATDGSNIYCFGSVNAEVTYDGRTKVYLDDFLSCVAHYSGTAGCSPED